MWHRNIKSNMLRGLLLKMNFFLIQRVTAKTPTNETKQEQKDKKD